MPVQLGESGDEIKPQPSGHHKPVAEAIPEKGKQIVQAVADQNVRQIQHEVRQQVFHAHAINEAISVRAQELHPKLIANNPALAAELLLGPTKTADLNKVSHAALDAWNAHLADVSQQQQTAYEQSPTALYGPVVVEYAQKAANIKDKTQQALYLHYVQQVAQEPDGPEHDAHLQFLPTVYQGALNGTLTPEESGAQQIIHGVGQMIAAPITLPIKIFSTESDVLQSGLGGVEGWHIPGVSPIAGALQAVSQGIQTGAGAALHAVGTVGQFATRNIEAAVLYTPGHEDYFTSWHESETGDHSPFSRFVAEHVLNTDANDPRYQGLFDVVDLTADLATQVVVFKALARFKAYQELPEYAGGGKTGGEFVADELSKKGGVVTKIQQALSTPSTRPTPVKMTTRGEIGKIGLDNGKYVYRIDRPTAVARVAEKGFEGTTSTTGKVYFSDDPFATYDLSDYVTSQGIGGEFNIYRVPKDATTMEQPKEYVAGGVRRGVIEVFTNEGWKPVLDTSASPLVTPRVRLIDRFKGINASLADRLVELGPNPTLEEVGRTIAEHIDTRPGARYWQAKRELETIKDRQMALAEQDTMSAADHVEFDTLQAKGEALRTQMGELADFEPVWKFPKESRIRNFMRGGTDNLVQRALGRIFGETGPWDVSKVADDLAPHERRIADPGGSVRPFGWAEDNLNALRKEFNVRKVPKVVQRDLLEQMLKFRPGDDTFGWQMDVERALIEGNGKRPLSEGAASQMRFHNRIKEERMAAPIEIEATLPDGTRITQLRNAFESADGEPLPSQPNELSTGFTLPDMQLLQDVTSWVKYKQGLAAEHFPALNKAIRVPLDIARFVTLTLPRLIIRPSILVTRGFLGALSPMGMKIQLDQAVRMFQVGLNPLSGKVADMTAAGVEKGAAPLPEEGVTALGAVANETMPGLDYVTMKIDTRFIDPNLKPLETELIGTARWEQLRKLGSDEYARKVAALGPEDAKAWLETHPESRPGQWWTDMQPKLERAGVTPEQFLANKDLEINQASGYDPALREAIATGNWHVGRDVPTGYGVELQLRMDEIAEARSELSVTEDPTIRHELNLRIEDAQRAIDWLERNNPTGQVIKLTDKDAVTGQLLNNWRDGSYRMPNEVIIEKPTMRLEGAETGTKIVDRARLLAQRANRFLYRGMKNLSAQDFTRQRTYKQVLGRTYQDLVDHGFMPAEALRIAQYRAAGFAKDLHYDISARSSMDRKIKDAFWFAPVWREQMLTYLYKIPSRAYWPAGLVLTITEAHTLVQGLKGLGLLVDQPYYNPETGKNESRLTVRVPWMSDFIAKALKNSEAGGISIEGFNPVTPGTSGLFPTFSPGFEKIFDLTAKSAPKELLPLFELGSRLFEFDKNVEQGPNFIPRPLLAMLELLGIHAPFDTLSPSAWGEAQRKAKTQARRWAMSDLAADGILPPTQDSTPAESRKYYTLLSERAQHYEQTLGFVHLIGAMVLPGAVVTGGAKQGTSQTKAGAAYYRWRYETGPLADNSIPFGSDQYYSIMDEYLRAHPAAWPYSVSTHPGENDPNWVPYGSPTYGSTTLEPETYVQRAIDRTSYWRDDQPADQTTTTDPGTTGTNGEDYASLSPRRQQVALVNYATTDVGEVTPEQLDALGVPDFMGRQPLFKKFGEITDEAAKAVDKLPNLSDEDKQRIYAIRDVQLALAASKYGKEGSAALAYYHGTPAQRLQNAGYFQSPAAQLVMVDSAAITRHAIAAGASPMYASESDGVLQAKVDMYRKLELLRQTSPKFDADIRRAEIALHVKDRTAGRVAIYEYLFFGQPSNYFGYQDDIVRRLNAS